MNKISEELCIPRVFESHCFLRNQRWISGLILLSSTGQQILSKKRESQLFQLNISTEYYNGWFFLKGLNDQWDFTIQNTSDCVPRVHMFYQCLIIIQTVWFLPEGCCKMASRLQAGGEPANTGLLVWLSALTGEPPSGKRLELHQRWHTAPSDALKWCCSVCWPWSQPDCPGHCNCMQQ